MVAMPWAPAESSACSGGTSRRSLPVENHIGYCHAMVRLVALLCCLVLVTPAWAGFDEGEAAYQRGDYETALREWRPLAELGDTGAQYLLGTMYEYGIGVPQDYAEAVKWYRLAAEQGDAEAQFNLGYIYDNGRGVPQDYIQAHMWYNLAAARGNELAVKTRDIVAKKMTPAGVSKAQRMAKEWLAKHKAD